MGRNLLFLFVVIIVAGCNNSPETKLQLADYDLSSAEKFNMPSSLLEISGVTTCRQKPDTFYAIQDEEGKLFR
ncbi:MAG: SdiA-regulated family protein, partial [Chitinophagaceae bacterium]